MEGHTKECSLRNIMIALKDFTDIESLMVQLGLDYRRVQMIVQNSRPGQNPLMICMDEWIRGSTDDASWDEIIDALENCGHYKLARKIKQECWMPAKDKQPALGLPSTQTHVMKAEGSSIPLSGASYMSSFNRKSAITFFPLPDVPKTKQQDSELPKKPPLRDHGYQQHGLPPPIKVNKSASLPVGKTASATVIPMRYHSNNGTITLDNSNKDPVDMPEAALLREKYNNAARNVEKFHLTVQEEIQSAKSNLSDDQAKLEEYFVHDLSELHARVKDLVLSSEEYEQKLTDALDMLAKGDSSALSILDNNNYSYEKMERESHNLESAITKLKRKIPTVSTAQSPNSIQEDLKDMLKITYEDQTLEEDLYAEVN